MKTFSLKIMAFAIMLLSINISAFADTWTDSSTGITWTYTVLSNGTVALGGGSNSKPAVPKTTSGSLTVPAQINGMDVTSLMAYAFYNCDKITSIRFLSQPIKLQKNASYIFYYCRALTSISNIGSWDTSDVTNLEKMFYACTSLKNLNGLNNWDTSKVTNLKGTFQTIAATNFTPLANWDTSNVTTLSQTFSNSKIEDLTPLANWDTSKVTSLSETFYACSGITDLTPLANWDTSNVTTIYRLFNCENITSLHGLENWNISKITELNETFQGCTNLTDLSALAYWDVKNLNRIERVFSGCSSITDLTPLANWNTSNVTVFGSMFTGCESITSLHGLENWNTSNATYLSVMFYDCKGLSDISALTNWNTSKVTRMSQMFQNCINLTNITPLANWDTSNVTTMMATFRDCKNINSLDALANWNTGEVTDMKEMFMGCQSITSLEPIGKWNTGNVTTMKNMFTKTADLKYANEINNWNIQKVTDMTEMFAFSGLVYINMSSWDVTGKNLNCMFVNGLNGNLSYSQGTSYYFDQKPRETMLERIYLPKKGLTKIPRGMFYNCKQLKEITIPSTVTTIEGYAFASCNSLKEITIPSKVTSIGDRAFWECYSITEVYCMPNTPPTAVDNKYFFGDTYGSINKTLYVKTSSLEQYQNQNAWKRFSTIVDIIPIVIGSGKNYSTLTFDFDADFSETEGIQPYIANKYLEGEDAADYLSGFEAKKRFAPGLQKVASTVNPDIKLIVLARYPDGYVPSRTGEDNFDFHGVIVYGQPGTYYFKMGEQDFASGNQKTVTWSTNYMKSAYESWLLNPTYDHAPINWMEYPKNDTYNFVLKNNLFKYIDNAGTISRHKSWLELPAEKVSGTYFEAGAKMVSMFDPDDSDSFATGLSFIVEDEPAEIQNRYNLNGQKVDASYKGVVIVNGKKIYNK